MSDPSPEQSDDNSPRFAIGSDRWAWTSDDRWHGSTRLVGGLVLLITLAFLWRLGGLFGVGTWLVVAGSWLVFPPIVPVAIGQFALVAVAPETNLEAGVTAAALVALLGADFVDRPTTGVGISRQGVVYALCFAGLCLLLTGLLFGVEASNGIGVAVAAVSVLTTGFAYTMYRYSVVAFDRLPEEEPGPER